MSRRKNALIATAFNYAQWGFGTVAAFYVTRLVLAVLGKDVYGMWLATGAVLGYAALADLGILGVMPWMFADADGKKDTPALRSLLIHGLAAGVTGGIIYAALATALWISLPGLLHLSPDDRAALRGPVAATITLTAMGYPLRLFGALRLGLQDYSFTGVLTILHTLLTFVVTVSLTYGGHGLYGLALAAPIPATLSGVVSLVRTVKRNPDLFRDMPRIRWPVLREIVVSGTGVWIGSLGWQLAYASDSVILAHLGYRSAIPVFVITSRLGLTLMQISWSLPESASVGLAQLNAEGDRHRVGSVVIDLVRFHLITAGVIACGVMAGNFGFVTGWTGTDLYGGAALNAMFAVDLTVLSVVHAVTGPASVLGARLRIGIATLVHGGLHVLVALVLGRHWGLVGVASATAISGLLTTLPIGAKTLSEMTPITMRTIFREVIGSWLVRVVPCGAVALFAGWFLARRSVLEHWSRSGALVVGVTAGGVVGLTYLFSVRRLVRDLPFGPRMRRVLATLRLV